MEDRNKEKFTDHANQISAQTKASLSKAAGSEEIEVNGKPQNLKLNRPLQGVELRTAFGRGAKIVSERKDSAKMADKK